MKVDLQKQALTESVILMLKLYSLPLVNNVMNEKIKIEPHFNTIKVEDLKVGDQISVLKFRKVFIRYIHWFENHFQSFGYLVVDNGKDVAEVVCVYKHESITIFSNNH